MSPTFVYDSPTATFRSSELSSELRARASRPGPVLPLYGAVRFAGLHELANNQDVLRVLVYQARYLRSLFPKIEPELRVGLDTDYGRTLFVVWYAPEFECLLDAGTSLLATAIRPAEVL